LPVCSKGPGTRQWAEIRYPGKYCLTFIRLTIE
jgi:hypothetical protein